MKKTVKRSIDLDEPTMEKVNKIAALEHRPAGQILRRYIEQGIERERIFDLSDMKKQLNRVEQKLDVILEHIGKKL